MNLMENLRRERHALLERWKTEALLPEQNSRHFYAQLNPFANPFAFTLVKALEVLLDSLTDSGSTEATERALDDIIRIRAVQEASPSRSLQFLFDLKTILREHLGAEFTGSPEGNGLERKIDSYALRAFDIYTSCKEQIFRIQLDQIEQGSPLQNGCPSAFLDRAQSEKKVSGAVAAGNGGNS